MLLVVLVVGWDHDPGDDYFRLIGVLAVLNTLGTLLVPILRRAMPLPRRPGLRTSRLSRHRRWVVVPDRRSAGRRRR